MPRGSTTDLILTARTQWGAGGWAIRSVTGRSRPLAAVNNPNWLHYTLARSTLSFSSADDARAKQGQTQYSVSFSLD